MVLERRGMPVGMELQRILLKELDEYGVTVLRDQCAAMSKDLHTLRIEDVPRLSRLVVKAIQPSVGYERTQRIEKEMQKFKILVELKGMSGEKMSEHNTRREVNALVALGNISRTIGDWEEAIGFYKRSMSRARPIKYELKEAEALRSLGHIYKRRNNWDDATRYFKKSLALSNHMRDNTGISDANRGLGYVEWRKGRYEGALEYYGRAMEAARKAGDDVAVGTTHLEFGLVHSDIGQLEKAKEEYLNAIEVLTAAREYQQAARAYNNLGDLYLQSEEFDEAIECFSKCREESTKINHQMMIGWGWFNEGECMIKKGDPKGGIEYCKKALVIVEKLDDRIGTYAVERNLGLGYGLMEDWEESEKHFKRSKEIIEKLDSPFNLGHLLF
ncbi:MAG: tetratricopeptide repeat protein [Thermoplasmata archaeon]|nr:tetratricopeptide repeat protein [Thermoplasmata archaeon]